MLNVTAVCSEQRFANGNIRLVEKLTITLSSGKEPRATQRLQKQIEERITTPENYDIPIHYTEEILTGPRRIDIIREAEIKPQEGLSEFLTSAQSQVFEFGELRRYSIFVRPSE
uniref:Ras-associating domain-containing protein n=1 Tax=Elaeophora elaphi TaxID=1147741 RepID=A0A0R3S3B3_9BILA